jgi:hypothetical protein
MKAKAVRFVRDVLDDEERAEEIEDESPESYAQRKRITISNPKRRASMTTKADLEERVKELEEENEELQDRLDQIASLSVADVEDDEELDEDDSGDDEDPDYDDGDGDLGED